MGTEGRWEKTCSQKNHLQGKKREISGEGKPADALVSNISPEL